MLNIGSGSGSEPSGPEPHHAPSAAQQNDAAHRGSVTLVAHFIHHGVYGATTGLAAADTLSNASRLYDLNNRSRPTLSEREDSFLQSRFGSPLAKTVNKNYY
jgi:hypothetical protein